MRFFRGKKPFISGDTVVHTEDVTRFFGTGERVVRVLRGVDLTVHVGEIVALYGPSGSGKTTLLNLIGGLDTPTEGRIVVGDADLGALRARRLAKLRREHIGFIFQNNTLIQTYTALENVDFALRLPGFGFMERRRRSKSALEAVGLSAWADHVPDELSGGQRQRVAIARALALRPELILADEPTSGLDTRTARRVMKLFQGVSRSQGTAFIVVSHDPVVEEYVNSAYDLRDGQLVHRTQLPDSNTHNHAKPVTEDIPEEQIV